MLADKLKGFFKDSLIYGIGDALGRLISLIMLPILSRAFAPADYGAIDLLTVGYMFVLIGISLNAYPGITKQYYKLSIEEQKTLVTSACVYLICLAVAVSALLVFTASCLSELILQTPDLISPIRILALCLPIELFFNFLQLLLRLERKAVLFMASNVIRVIIMPLLVLLMVVGLDLGIIGVFISKMISLSILTTAIFFLERKKFGTTIRFHVFSTLIRFTLPGYPAMIIKQLMEMLPRAILAAFAPLSAVGLFGIASRVCKLMNIYVIAFNRSWSPFAFAHADMPDEKKIYEIIFKTFSFSLILLGLGLSLFAEEVIMVLTPSRYHSAYSLVAGIVFYQGTRGLTQIFGTALYVTEKVKWISYLDMVQLVVFLIGALVLIPRYHSFGLIIALDIAVVVFFFCFMQVTLINFSFFIPKFKLGFLFSVATIAIFLLNLFTGTLLVKISIKISFIACYIGIGIIFLLTPNERQKTKKLILDFLPSVKRC